MELQCSKFMSLLVSCAQLLKRKQLPVQKHKPVVGSIPIYCFCIVIKLEFKPCAHLPKMFCARENGCSTLFAISMNDFVCIFNLCSAVDFNAWILTDHKKLHSKPFVKRTQVSLLTF